jgi:CubicO group peptidase (beta-lactamase class C family)
MSIKPPRGLVTSTAHVIATLLILLPMLAGCISVNTGDTKLAAQIDHLLADTFKASEPGAAVIVVRNGQVIVRKGYGLAN